MALPRTEKNSCETFWHTQTDARTEKHTHAHLHLLHKLVEKSSTPKCGGCRHGRLLRGENDQPTTEHRTCCCMLLLSYALLSFEMIPGSQAAKTTGRQRIISSSSQQRLA
eukprot:2018750-Pleurochrysis_carterae.AAC.1